MQLWAGRTTVFPAIKIPGFLLSGIAVPITDTVAETGVRFRDVNGVTVTVLLPGVWKRISFRTVSSMEVLKLVITISKRIPSASEMVTLIESMFSEMEYGAYFDHIPDGILNTAAVFLPLR